MTDDSDDEITAVEIDPEMLKKPSEEVLEEIEENREQISLVAHELGETNTHIEEIRAELEEMNETLESNERHIHFLPADANISSPILSFELTLAAFALALPILQFAQGNTVNELSAALGAALLVHPILSFFRNR